MNFLLNFDCMNFPQYIYLLQMQIKMCKIIKFKIVSLQSSQYSLLFLFNPQTKNDLTPSEYLLYSF